MPSMAAYDKSETMRAVWNARQRERQGLSAGDQNQIRPGTFLVRLV
jgi:hypothetical protein